MASGLKEKIFLFLCSLSRFSSDYNSLKLFVFSLETFQLYYLFFHDEVRFWEDNSPFSNFHYFFSLFAIKPYLLSYSWDTFLYIFYGLIVFTVTNSLIIFTTALLIQKRVHVSGSLLKLLEVGSFIHQHALLIPLLEMYLLIAKCEASNFNTYVHENFKEIQCFNTSHSIHLFFGICTALILWSELFLHVFIYGEFLIGTNCVDARCSNRRNVLINIFKTILITLYSIFNPIDYSSFFMILICVGSAVIFHNRWTQTYFYETKMRILSHFQTFSLVWNSLTLIYFKTLPKSISSSSTFVFWLSGFIIFTTYAINKKIKNFHFLVQDTNSFKSASHGIKFLIRLFNSVLEARESEDFIMLGFFELHRKVCKHKTCPVFKDTFKPNYITKALLNKRVRDETIHLYQVIDHILNRVLRKFPEDFTLKIIRVAFAFKILESTQLASKWIKEMNSSHLGIVDSFKLFRTKKLIEESFTSASDKGADKEIPNDVLINESINNFMTTLEGAALAHENLWLLASEKSIILEELIEANMKIESSSKLLKNCWKSICDLNIHNYGLVRIYTRYLMSLSLKQTKAEKVLKNFKDKRIINREESIDISQIHLEPQGIVIVSAEEENFGQVINLNNSILSMFGYLKPELLNKKIENLMPELYAKRHDKFMKDYIDTLNPRILNKELGLLCKHKSNYIFPVKAMIRHVSSIRKGLQFIGRINPEKSLKIAAYLIVEGETMNVIALSSSCICLLNLTVNKISEGKVKIFDIIPDFVQEEYLGKTKFLEEYGASITTTPISFRGEPLSGFTLQIEKIRESNLLSMKKALEVSKQPLPGVFFSFDPIKLKYLGNVRNLATLENPATFVFEENTDYTSTKQVTYDEEYFQSGTFLNKFGLISSEKRSLEAIKLGNIKRMILFENKIISPEELEEQEDAMEVQNESQNIEMKVDQSIMEENPDKIFHQRGSYVKKEQVLNLHLKGLKGARSNMKILRYSIIVVLTVLIIIAIGFEANSSINLNSFRENYHRVDCSYKMNSFLQIILNKIGYLVLLNQNSVFPDIITETEVRQDLERNIYNLENYLRLHQTSSDSTFTFNVNMSVGGVQDPSSTKVFSINDGIRQIIGRSLKISHQKLESFTFSDSEINNLNINIISNLDEALDELTIYSENLLKDSYGEILQQDLMFLVAGAAACMLAIIVLSKLYTLNRNFQVLCYKAFLEIPMVSIKRILGGVKEYMEQIKSGDRDFGDEEFLQASLHSLEFNTQNDEEFSFQREGTKAGKRRKSKLKDKKRDFVLFIFKITIFLLVPLAYFVCGYFFKQTLLQNMIDYIEEISSIGFAMHAFSTTTNILRNILLTEDLVIGDMTGRQVLEEYYLSLTTTNHKINMFHSKHIPIHDPIYNNDYDSVTSTNLCDDDLADKLGIYNKTKCLYISRGVGMEGLFLVSNQFLEDLYQMKTFFDLSKQDQTFSAKDIYFVNKNGTTCPNVGHMEKLFCLENFYEMIQMHEFLISNSLKFLMDSFQNSLDRKFTNFSVLSLTITILLTLFMLSSYFVFWHWICSKISAKNLLALKAISLIPLQKITSNHGLNNILKKLKT